MSEITTSAVAEKLKKGDALHMIDVREDEEVKAGAIPGVHHIPLGDLSSRLDELDKSKTYIMICRSGGRSEKATQFLVNQGYQAKNMVGGMLDWAGPVDVKE